MSARLLTECGLCGSTNLEVVLSLGVSPPTCVMVPVGSRQASEDHHPLELWRCHDCTLVQLSVIVDPEVVFPPDYPYSSGNSKALHENFEDLARQAQGWHHGLEPDDLVVDIGTNDGTLLSKFTGCRTVGVEPTMQSHRITGPFYRAFFNENLATQIRDEHGPAKVITACNVLAHVEDIHDVMRGINLLLADDGVLIAENHDLASVVDGNQWDTVYHEHLRFYDPYSFDALLRMHGLGAQQSRSIPTHGGSFRTLADKRDGWEAARRDYDWPAFRKRAQRSRWVLRSAVSAIRAGGGRIGAIGASARATTIIAACGFDVDDIEAIYEVAGSDKIGRYIPGTRIPVVDESALTDKFGPPNAILFAWYMVDTIVPKLRLGVKGYKGQIIVPLPELRYLRTSAQTGRVAA